MANLEGKRKGILVIGAVFVDIKGFPYGKYIWDGRNDGKIEYIHGGVARNVVEDLGNLELRPTFLSTVDDSALGHEIIAHLKDHKVDTSYMKSRPNGMGKWLAVFDQNGDLAGSISERVDMSPLMKILDKKGKEIFENLATVCIQTDLPRDLLKKIFALAEEYHVKKYAVVANMAIATENRDILKQYDCLICNEIEAGQFFVDDYSGKSPEEMCEILMKNIELAKIPAMIVTMGGKGSVYASLDGEKGICPAQKVQVVDTTGAGDSFCAGVSAGLTYGKSLEESVKIGTRLAASVVSSSENVCRRFLPEEFGIDL